MITLENLSVVYEKARANKRRSVDATDFAVESFKELVGLMDDVNNRSFSADSNYAFVVTDPKPREIFATKMRNRVIHHYLDWRMRPIYESVLSGRSFNNRKGMGLHKAIDTFRDDVRELTNDYTNDAWIVHLDLKGYFPNANVEIALKQQLDLIDRYYDGEDKDDLRYMMVTCMRADLARHCQVFVPRSNWDCIAPEKSLFNKPTGIGAAIGFLCWQNAMGMYINDVIRWLESFDFMRVVVFVDDIYIVTSDKSAFLALMPELRSRLAKLDVRLNEKKFYCQHYSKGVMMLGTMLKFDRAYCSNRTFKNAVRNVERWSENASYARRHPQSLLCSVNSHIGCLKKRDQYRRLQTLKNLVEKKLKFILEWNEKKNCFKLKDKFTVKNFLKRKYRLDKAVWED